MYLFDIVYQYNLKSISKGQICMSIITYAQFQSKYRFQGQISRGTFGRVFQIKEINSKKLFALKKITTKKPQHFKDAQNQIQILTTLKHPLVVDLRQYYHFQIGNHSRNTSHEFGIILELASGSVQQLLKSRRKIGSVQSIIKKLFGLVQVLALFQNLNIAHRDIKPGNILIFGNDDGETIWKLADFGLAINLNQNSQIQNIAGSYDYVSPLLKRKFNFRNLKIKTNPFKDDVYSLGITFLQIFTGQRKYNQDANLQLKEILRDIKLVQLIESMLSQQQSKRPCFNQLFSKIKQSFEYSPTKQYRQPQDFDLQNKKMSKAFSFKDFEEKEHLIIEQDSPNTRTICKKDLKTPRLSLKEIKDKQIRCVIGIDGWIMCGCKDGDILLTQNNKQEDAIQLQRVHQKYVGVFQQDRSGNIWSVGGDGFILKFKKYSLLKALINDTKQKQIIKKNVFKREITKKRILDMNSHICKKIQIPFVNKSGISSLFVIDQQKYAVGFNDGHIFMFWNYNQIYIKPHRNPIISIKISNNNMYTCSVDGQLKFIDLQSFRLQPRLYICQQFCVGMEILGQGAQSQICLSTSSGKIIYLNRDLQQILKNKINEDQMICSSVNSDRHYSLTENGYIYDTRFNQKIIDLRELEAPNKGWNCFKFISENQIALGNFQGKIAIAQF